MHFSEYFFTQVSGLGLTSPSTCSLPSDMTKIYPWKMVSIPLKCKTKLYLQELLHLVYLPFILQRSFCSNSLEGHTNLIISSHPLTAWKRQSWLSLNNCPQNMCSAWTNWLMSSSTIKTKLHKILTNNEAVGRLSKTWAGDKKLIIWYNCTKYNVTQLAM